jgi:hypothetical protein
MDPLANENLACGVAEDCGDIRFQVWLRHGRGI